jgi:hypothetical protein
LLLTGVGDCKEELQDTGDRLAEFAQFFNIPFVFHEVIDRLEDIRLWMLHVKEDEVIAVNCITQLHRMLYDSGETIKDFLGLIDSTKPKVVAIVEQEGSHNGPHFEGRFLESLKYYSAILPFSIVWSPIFRRRAKLECRWSSCLRKRLATFLHVKVQKEWNGMRV